MFAIFLNFCLKIIKNIAWNELVVKQLTFVYIEF